MIKVIFIVADITAHGGVERVITFLSSALAEKRYNVEILSLHKGSEKIAFPVSNVKIRFVDDHIYSGGKPRSMAVWLSHLKSASKLNKLLMKERGSVIVANSFPVAVLLFPLLLFLKNKYVVVEHVHHDYYPNFIQWIRKYLYKKFYRTVSLTDADTSFYKRNGLKAVTIPNALSFEAKRVNISTVEKKKIIAAGRLEYQKGFDILIESFSKLEDSLKNSWKLDIYGIGSQEGALQRQIDELGLSKQITLMGFSQSLDSLYAEYDFFVMSSRFEGFGMVILEAMSCGLPVISFDCPNGPKDLLNDGRYGMLVHDITANQLSESINTLINDSQLRQELSQKSLERSSHYKLEEIICFWENLFNSDTD